jgi:hypothetical protein
MLSKFAPYEFKLYFKPFIVMPLQAKPLMRFLKTTFRELG